jgi:hypothetical protein
VDYYPTNSNKGIPAVRTMEVREIEVGKERIEIEEETATVEEIREIVGEAARQEEGVNPDTKEEADSLVIEEVTEIVRRKEVVR